MLLRSEDLALAVVVFALVRILPLAVSKVDKKLLFTLMALELNAFNKNLDR